MAKGKDLRVKRGSPPKERSKSGEQGGEGRGHRRGSLTGSAENINDFGGDGIFGKDKGQPGRAVAPRFSRVATGRHCQMLLSEGPRTARPAAPWPPSNRACRSLR